MKWDQHGCLNCNRQQPWMPTESNFFSCPRGQQHLDVNCAWPQICPSTMTWKFAFGIAFSELFCRTCLDSNDMWHCLSQLITLLPKVRYRARQIKFCHQLACHLVLYTSSYLWLRFCWQCRSYRNNGVQIWYRAGTNMTGFCCHRESEQTWQSSWVQKTMR